MESEAILSIINRSKQNSDEIIGSPVLILEIDQIDDIEKKEKVKYFYEQTITVEVNYTANILNRVHELSKQTKIRTLDMFHLSFAENSGADILLTTDIKLEKNCSKLNLNIKVMNPLKYLTEAILDEYNT